jgi:4-amino-4-deoxy-L-arabinose transferase-like glycosyltransferase
MLRHQAWIVLVAGVVFFAGLGGPRLWDDDETKNARCAQEMLVRGDWVVPTFNFRLRPDKPALFYWLAMISYQLLGTTEFAARLPSALLAVGTSLATYHLGRRLFRPEVGLWAGLAMASNLMFAMIGRAATPDSTLIFCTTIALLAYVVGVGGGTWGERQAASEGRFRAVVPRSWWCFAVTYAAMGLAVLAKGPVGVVLPVAAVGAFVLFEGSVLKKGTGASRRDGLGNEIGPSLGASPLFQHLARPEFGTLGGELRYDARWMLWRLRSLATDIPAAVVAMRPLTLIVAVLLVALPWYAWVAIRTHGLWWHEFFWEHNVQRFVQSREGHHGLLLFPPLTLIACFFPWSLFLPVALAAAIRRIRRGEGNAAACRLILWWSAVWIVFFSICGTKQPNYILPAYPALAILVGLWIADWIAAPQKILGRRLLPAIWSAFGLSGLGLAIALVVASRWFPETAKFSWIGLIPLAGAGCAWICARRHLPRLAMASVVASTALLFAAVLGGVAAPLSREQNGVRLGEFVGQLHDAPSKLGQFRLAFVGLVYYADRKVEELGTADEAAALFAGGANPLVATDPEGFAQLNALLPGELQIVTQKPRFCRPGAMVLVTRAPTIIASKSSPPTRWK